MITHPPHTHDPKMDQQYPVGAHCKIKDLTSETGQKLNGQKCVIISMLHATSRRYSVQILNGSAQKINIKPVNLQRYKPSRSRRKETTHTRAMTLVTKILSTQPGSARMDTQATKKQVTERRHRWFNENMINREISCGYLGGLQFDEMQYEIEGSTYSPRLKHLLQLRQLGVKEFKDGVQGRLARKWFPTRNEETSIVIPLLIESLLDGCEMYVRSNKEPSYPKHKRVQPCEAQVSLHILKELVSSQFDINEKNRNFIVHYLSVEKNIDRMPKYDSQHGVAAYSMLLGTLCYGIQPHISPPLWGYAKCGGTHIALPAPGRLFGSICLESTSLHTSAIELVTSLAMQSAERQLKLGDMPTLMYMLCLNVRRGSWHSIQHFQTGDTKSGILLFSLSNSMAACRALANLTGRSSAVSTSNLQAALTPSGQRPTTGQGSSNSKEGILQSLMVACSSWLDRYDNNPKERRATADSVVPDHFPFAQPLVPLCQLLHSFIMSLSMHKEQFTPGPPQEKAQRFWASVTGDCQTLTNTVAKIESRLFRVLGIALTDGDGSRFKGFQLEKGVLSSHAEQALLDVMQFLAYLHLPEERKLPNSTRIRDDGTGLLFPPDRNVQCVSPIILSGWLDQRLYSAGTKKKKKHRTVRDAIAEHCTRTEQCSAGFLQYFKINPIVFEGKKIQLPTHHEINKKIRRQNQKRNLGSEVVFDVETGAVFEVHVPKEESTTSDGTTEKCTGEGPCSLCGKNTKKICACKNKRWCSVACQKTGWPGHKVECKRIRRKDGKKG